MSCNDGNTSCISTRDHPLLLCKHDVHQFCRLSNLKFAQSHNNIAVVLLVPRSFGRKHLLLWVAQNIPNDDWKRCQIPLLEVGTFHNILLPYCTHVGRVHLEHRLKKIATSSRVWRVIPPWFQGWAHHLSVQVSLKLGDAAGLGGQVGRVVRNDIR